MMMMMMKLSSLFTPIFLLTGLSWMARAVAALDPVRGGGGGVRRRSDSFDSSSDSSDKLTGSYTLTLDITTLALYPISATKCHVTVGSEDFTFTGDVAGVATGAAAVIIDGPCGPPGDSPDKFVAILDFVGTVEGELVEANVLFVGETAVGGAVTGYFSFSGTGVTGRLDVFAANVGQGGSYTGTL